ncbi:SUMF1/EgtB/PvdO family nonheme iron enzyme [bacterium]|nr:SUMF1/EgtB/PvdO family nonheme iron enzyme [bacterium]
MKSAIIFFLLYVPNCLPIDSGRYLDKNEVTNKEYFWFVLDSKSDLKVQLYPAQEFKDVYGVEFKDITPDNPLMQMPVVGVSMANCLAFCKWRTEKVKTKFPDLNIAFSLPTADDYKLANNQRIKSHKTPEIFGYKNRNIARNTKCFVGLDDNVAELLQDGTVQPGSVSQVGFRCVAVAQ